VVEEPEVVVHEADQPDFFVDLLMPTFWPANTLYRLIFRGGEGDSPVIAPLTIAAALTDE
jgi:hypothetical protein